MSDSEPNTRPTGSTMGTPADRRTIVSYSDVRKEYNDGEVVAVSDIDLDIQSGEFVSFVGPSGCGKTTLLHLTAGLLDPTAGSVEIDGTNVRSPAHEKHKLGLVFQKPILLEWRTVTKNVLLPVEILLEVIDVDLPRPRDEDTRTSERYQELVRDAYKHFRR